MVLIFMVAVLMNSTLRADRAPCERRDGYIGYSSYFCENATFEVMYSLSTTSTNYYYENLSFTIKNSYINSLVADGKKWPRVKWLTLNETNTSTIIPGFFSGFTELRLLKIINNHIRDIVDGVFSPLTRVDYLDLSNNSIYNLGQHAFLGLSSLWNLYLKENQISVLPPDVFSPLDNLYELDISSNSITRFVNISKLTSVKELYLRQNRLTEFDFNNVSSNMNVLDISKNNISSLKNLEIFQSDNVNVAFNLLRSLKKIGKIKTFNVSHNHLEQLSESVASNSVTKLDLSFNKVRSVSLQTFSESVNLEILHFNHNDLKVLPTAVFRHLSRIRVLDLSKNLIYNLEQHAFLDLSTLESLDLKENQISLLLPDVFYPLDNLRYLDISSNSITRFVNISKLMSVEKLYLRQNRLTEFDFNNVSSNMNVLDISKNNISNLKNLEIFQSDNVNVAFNLLTSLRKIGKISIFNVSHNQLEQLTESVASNSVTELDLSFNKIRSVSSQTFCESVNLKILHLNHNDLKVLPNAVFRHLNSLEYLDLSYNNIKHLEFGTFNDLKNLKYFSISHNKGILDLHIFSRSLSLESLNFDENDVNNLNKNFLDTHPKLTNISMSGSSWNCSDLAHTIYSLESKNITIIRGPTEHSSNVHGIACKSNFDYTLLEQKYNLALNDSDSEKDDLESSKFLQYFKDMTEKLEYIFNKTEKKIENITITNNILSSEHLKNDSLLIVVVVLLLLIFFGLLIGILGLKKRRREPKKEHVELLG